MITRHHLGLAFGSMSILYFPLFSVDPLAFAAISAGVCTGVVLPDIQMKRPRQIKALFLAWLLVQVFKKTVLNLYLFLYRRTLGMNPHAEDKRLTHSLPGLLFLTGMLGYPIILILWMFPEDPGLHQLRIFLAGIIMGLLLHFMEDICTKKGVYPFYPFSETCRIAGSIRPCSREDPRIRLFHITLALVIIAIFLLYCTGICPDFLKWPVSIAALGSCTVLMLYLADVRIHIPEALAAPHGMRYQD